MADLKKIVETLSQLTVLEAAELSKILEEKWGISASSIISNIPNVNNNIESNTNIVEEKSEFEVVLVNCGSQKINVIKEVRSITGLGLKEAKDIVEGAPKTIKEGLSKDDAEKIKIQLENAGAKIELK